MANIRRFEEYRSPKQSGVKSRQSGVENWGHESRQPIGMGPGAKKMAKIERFEDIKAWKQGRELAKDIYTVTGKGNFARDYGLKDQIRRASVSIISNIAEGFSRQTDKEFVQFLHIAKGSTSEVQSQLYIAADLGYISQEEFTKLYNQADEVARLATGFIKYLKGDGS